MRRILSILFGFSLVPVLGGAEPTASRFIQFRDGSIVRLSVLDEPRKITLIGPDVHLADITLPLSKLQGLTLVPDNLFVQKRNLLETIGRLGSDNFGEREQAQAALTKLGPEIRPDLDLCLSLSSRAEMVRRINDVLKVIPPGDKAPASRFDLIQLKKAYWGHIGDKAIAVLVKGSSQRLGRKDVLGLSASPPLVLGITDFRGSSAFRRLELDDFPPGCVEEGFEKAPDGRPLRQGENIERLFVDKGFILSTSATGSYVSVNSFLVLGKSRGLSVATHQPLWEGEITVRFVQPGHPDVPAGVTHFGAAIAAVVPGGTALVAYDLDGREIGRIESNSNGHAFLGVYSPIPMHRVRFVPNVKLDRDYTLDDFIFSPPQSPELRHPEKFTVYLNAGDRFFCSDVTLGKDTVRFHGMPAGLPDHEVPRADVLRINAPDQGQPFAPPPPGLFAELRDGSVLFAPLAKGGLIFPRRPALLKDHMDVVGLWSSSFPRLIQTPPPGKAVVWQSERKQWQEIDEVRFLAAAVNWKGAAAALPYHQLPPLWLSKPSPGPAPGWHVRLASRDDLVMAGPEQLTGRLSAGLQGAWQGQKLRFMPGELRSIYQVFGVR